MADITVTPANVAAGGQNTRVALVQTGEAVTQGQAGYKGTDNKYYRAVNNDTAAKANASVIFFTSAGVDGYSVVALSGPVNLGATLVVGQLYVVSSTLGGIAPLADQTSTDFVTTLGVATTTALLDFAPNATGVQTT